MDANDEKKWECSICCYTSKTEISLGNHVKCHGSGKAHGCQFCDYAHDTQGELTKHLKQCHIIELDTEDDTDEVEFAQYVGTEAMIPAAAFGEMWAKETYGTESYDEVKIKAAVVSRDGLGGFLIYCSELKEFEQYETTNMEWVRKYFIPVETPKRAGENKEKQTEEPTPPKVTELVGPSDRRVDATLAEPFKHQFQDKHVESLALAMCKHDNVNDAVGILCPAIPAAALLVVNEVIAKSLLPQWRGAQLDLKFTIAKAAWALGRGVVIKNLKLSQEQVKGIKGSLKVNKTITAVVDIILSRVPDSLKRVMIGKYSCLGPLVSNQAKRNTAPKPGQSSDQDNAIAAIVASVSNSPTEAELKKAVEQIRDVVAASNQTKPLGEGPMGPSATCVLLPANGQNNCAVHATLMFKHDAARLSNCDAPRYDPHGKDSFQAVLIQRGELASAIQCSCDPLFGMFDRTGMKEEEEESCMAGNPLGYVAIHLAGVNAKVAIRIHGVHNDFSTHIGASVDEAIGVVHLVWENDPVHLVQHYNIVEIKDANGHKTVVMDKEDVLAATLVKSVVDMVRRDKMLRPTATATKASVAVNKSPNNQVVAQQPGNWCKHHMRGTCNRNPCKFRHMDQELVDLVLAANKLLPANAQVTNPTQRLKSFQAAVAGSKSNPGACRHTKPGKSCKFWPDCKFRHPDVGSQPESGRNGRKLVGAPSQTPGPNPRAGARGATRAGHGAATPATGEAQSKPSPSPTTNSGGASHPRASESGTSGPVAPPVSMADLVAAGTAWLSSATGPSNKPDVPPSGVRGPVAPSAADLIAAGVSWLTSKTQAPVQSVGTSSTPGYANQGPMFLPPQQGSYPLPYVYPQYIPHGTSTGCVGHGGSGGQRYPPGACPRLSGWGY